LEVWDCGAGEDGVFGGRTNTVRLSRSFLCCPMYDIECTSTETYTLLRKLAAAVRTRRGN